MQRESLDYARPQPAHEPSRVWDALAGCSLAAPFLTVPVFVLGTVLLQDQLVNGDGRSWQRAALWFGTPTAVITVVVLAAAIRAVARGVAPRPAAIFAVTANSLALGFILYSILAA